MHEFVIDRRRSGHHANMRIWLVALLALQGSVGCGDGRGVPDSGPGADATTDAQTDAGTQGIRVRVIHGGPVAGVHVLFHDPAGALLARGVTDAQGEVVGDVPSGSMATVVQTPEPSPGGALSTIREAQRGDTIVVGDLHPFAVPGPMTLSVPPSPAPSPMYLAFADCGFASLTASTTLSFPIVCGATATGTIMVLAQSNGGITHYAELDDVPLVPGATATVAAWTPAVAHTAAIANVPANTHVRGIVEYLRNGRVFYRHAMPNNSPTESALDGVGGDAHRISVELVPNAVPFATQTASIVVADPTAISVDVASVALPPVVTGAFVTANHGISWTTANGGDAPAIIATATQTDGAGQPIASWSTVLSPASVVQSQIALPALPADLAGVWEGLGQDTTVGAVTLVLPADPYATYKLHAFTDLDAAKIVQKSSFVGRP
jgi:hypothetical protein